MHVVWFSPIRYEYLHQRPQKLAEQFLALGVAVTFVQPTGLRDLRSENHPIRFLFKSLWYHVLAFLSLVVPFMWRDGKPKAKDRQFAIVSQPVTLPINRFNSKLLEGLNASVLWLFVRREIVGEERTGAIAVFENPFWGKVIEGPEFDKVCYDCLDDLSIYAGHASLERFNAYEAMLLERSDVVVTTAAKLEARLRAKTSKPVHRIPNGVDDEWFRTRAEVCMRPADLASISRPIVGYVGNIAGWLDYDLIVAVAQLMPDVSFIFIGPAEHEGRIQQLQRARNILWLGRKPYDDVPAYIKAFDVCSIPFRRGEIAETTNPVKVFEYFALGKAVVSTPLSELHEYEKTGLVLFGDSPTSFAEALKWALAERGDERAKQRIQIAAAHSWRNHARAFLDALGVGEKVRV